MLRPSPPGTSKEMDRLYKEQYVETRYNIIDISVRCGNHLQTTNPILLSWVMGDRMLQYDCEYCCTYSTAVSSSSSAVMKLPVVLFRLYTSRSGG